MEFTWNYNDIEPNYSIEMDRSYSTKHGISRLLSFGLGGLGHVNDANRRDLAKNFKLIKRILKFTGLYIEDIKDNNFIYYLSIIRIFLIVVLTTYKILFTLCYLGLTENFDHHSHTSAGVITVLSWSLKAWFTMVFIIYWQYRGYISDLFYEMNKYNHYCSSKRARLYIIRAGILALIMFLVSINAAAVHSVLAHFGYNDRAMLDKRAQELIFYFWFSPYLSNFITLFAFIIWVVGLLFYVIILNILSGELEFFNKSLKESLENAPKNDMEAILLEKFSTYLKMTNIVLKVNNIFEVYTFVMVGLNIPTSMFTLISLVVGLKASWESAMFSIPTVVFSIIELIGLTAIPAKVHATIRKIHHILYGIPQLWNPYNEKTYHIATVFMDHINQNDLGISLWGFAIVTKPLILTTLSLIVTYLTILLQMKGNDY